MYGKEKKKQQHTIFVIVSSQRRVVRKTNVENYAFARFNVVYKQSIIVIIWRGGVCTFPLTQRAVVAHDNVP